MNSGSKTPDYYKDNGGKDLFFYFKNGLLKHDEYVGFLKGNVIKYLTRYDKKGQKQSDLNKMVNYASELMIFESSSKND